MLDHVQMTLNNFAQVAYPTPYLSRGMHPGAAAQAVVASANYATNALGLSTPSVVSFNSGHPQPGSQYGAGPSTHKHTLSVVSINSDRQQSGNQYGAGPSTYQQSSTSSLSTSSNDEPEAPAVETTFITNNHPFQIPPSQIGQLANELGDYGTELLISFFQQDK